MTIPERGLEQQGPTLQDCIGYYYRVAATVAAQKQELQRAEAGALVALQEAHRVRTGELLAILAAEKKGVCNDCSRGAGPEGSLGIFPQEQLTYEYRGHWKTNHEFPATPLPEEIDRQELLQLCPRHFASRGSRNTTHESDYFGVHGFFAAEVEDFRGAMVSRGLDGGLVEVGVPLNTNYGEAVYAHFGLPELPILPE